MDLAVRVESLSTDLLVYKTHLKDYYYKPGGLTFREISNSKGVGGR